MTAYALATAERSLGRMPDRLYMKIDGLTADEARLIADDAVTFAREIAPKMSGFSARRFQAVYGEGWFGVHWLDSYVWFQEIGIRPFTMKSLQGKTIPMWIDDPTGKERKKNPKAKTRMTESGKVQILIFRKARRPGAPGKINHREVGRPWTRANKVGGRIAPGNVGARWRHPGLIGRGFLHEALQRAAWEHGLEEGPIHVTTGAR